eukprot:c21435_g1_i2 orf=184-753(+)
MKGSGYVPPGYVRAPDYEPEDSDPLPSPADDSFGGNRQFSEHWSSGICACCDDMTSCCLGFWCPCVLFGKNVELLEGKPCTGPCLIHFLLWGVVTSTFCVLTSGTMLGVLGSCVPCYACGYRGRIRARYNLEDAPCGDLLTHICCHSCALCQEYREICDRSTTSGLPVVIAPPNQSMDGRPISASNTLQ